MSNEILGSLVSEQERTDIWIPVQYIGLNSFQLQIHWIDSEISLNQEEQQRRQEIVNNFSELEQRKAIEQKKWLTRVLLPLKDEFTKYKDDIYKAFKEFIKNNWEPFLNWITDLEKYYITYFLQWNNSFPWWLDPSLQKELWELLFYRFAYNFLRKKEGIKIEEIDRNEAVNIMIWIARDLYNEIYSKRKATIWDDLFAVWKWIDPNSEEPRRLFEEVDWEIWQYFDAHGISKSTQFDNLVNLLRNWLDTSRTFYTWPFSLPKDKAWLWAWTWTASWTTYKDWIAVLTSWYKETIQENWIKHIFINDVFAWLERILQWAFPQYQFHLLSQQKQVMENESKQKQS